MLVSVSQAAYLVRRDQRAVRYAIARGRLRAETGEDGYTRLDTEALAAVRGWRLDPARLAEVAAEDGRTAQALSERIRGLEQRMAAMERIIRDTLGEVTRSDGASMALEAPGAIPAYPDAPRAASAFSARYRAIPARRAGLPPLPDGLVSVASFAEAHGIPPQTWRKAMDVGRLVSVEGEWRVGRSLTRHALDAEGRAEFYRLWGHRPDFRKCASCPHG